MAELPLHWSSWWAILPVPETNGVSHRCWMNESVRFLVEPSSFTSLPTFQPSCVATAPTEYIHPLFWRVSKIKAQTKGEWWEPSFLNDVWRVQSIKTKNTFEDDSRLLPSYLCCWSFFTSHWKEPDSPFPKVFWKHLVEKSFEAILSNEKNFSRKQIPIDVCQPVCADWVLKTA